MAFCSSLLAAAVQPNTVGSKAAWYNQSVSSLPFVVDSFVGCLTLVLCCGGRRFLRPVTPVTPVSWLTFLFFSVTKYSEQLVETTLCNQNHLLHLFMMHSIPVSQNMKIISGSCVIRKGLPYLVSQFVCTTGHMDLA